MRFAHLQAWLGTQGSGSKVQAGLHVLGHSLLAAMLGWTQLELMARSSLRLAPVRAQRFRPGTQEPHPREGVEGRLL